VREVVDCQQIADMLSGYLDGELTQGDRQRVELHLESCADCRKSYEDMAALRQAVGRLSFGEMSPQQWRKMMNDVTVRSSRGLGWLLYVAGLVILVGFGAYEFVNDDTVPAIVKTGMVGVVIGLVLLFISVARQRLITRKTDRYKDVEI
jgi:anti-sigma factor (TIGR02949 family)